MQAPGAAPQAKGSTFSAPWRTLRCRCGKAASPDSPIRPSGVPAVTAWPGFTATEPLAMWQYWVSQPPRWVTSTPLPHSRSLTEAGPAISTETSAMPSRAAFTVPAAAASTATPARCAARVGSRRSSPSWPS